MSFARSRCEACGVTLTAAELVPLGSYVLQRGRCRRCGAAIDPFHPAIEMAALVVALWAILIETDPTRLWADCLLGWTFADPELDRLALDAAAGRIDPAAVCWSGC